MIRLPNRRSQLSTPLVFLLVVFSGALGAGARAGEGEPTTPSSPALGFSTEHLEQHLGLEARFDELLDAGEIEATIERLSARPHHVGSEHGRANAEWMVERLRSWGWQAEIAEYEILFPTPRLRHLEMLAPSSFVADLREPAVAPDTGAPDELPSYNAYSVDGDVTSELVYVNYGIPEDYEELEKRGISVEGKIVIARYGRSWRGIKPKVAAEHGAIGCVLYSDPSDDGFGAGDVYPEGGYRPAAGVQRGSVADMPIYPGDPSTPDGASLPGVQPLALSDIATLTKIPTLPISYADAKPLLSALGGQVAPRSWQGGLETTYHFGPGPARVRLALAFDWNRVTASNVIARMTGSELPDQWILRGNHHDAWVYGATDPVSGMAAVLAEAKALGELAKTGWRPRRTIVYAGWDAEEPGLIGSTEWVEHHARELDEKAVVYINSDSNSRGYFYAGGSPSLEQLVNQVAAEVDDPQVGGSVLERRLLSHWVNEQQGDLQDEMQLEPLGSGSDYSPFFQHLGIASLNIGFGGEGHYGQYHSSYDTFEHYRRFMDPSFSYGVALARVGGRLVLRLADAEVLPFEFTRVADRISGYVEEIAGLADELRSETARHNRMVAHGAFEKVWDPLEPWRFPEAEEAVPHLNLAPIHNALERVRETAAALGAMAPALEADSEVRARLDQLLYSTERALTRAEGLPERPWYVHYIYAPGFYTGYGVKTLPAVREAVEARRWHEVDAAVDQTAEVLEALAERLQQISAALDGS